MGFTIIHGQAQVYLGQLKLYILPCGKFYKKFIPPLRD